MGSTSWAPPFAYTKHEKSRVLCRPNVKKLVENEFFNDELPFRIEIAQKLGELAELRTPPILSLLLVYLDDRIRRARSANEDSGGGGATTSASTSQAVGSVDVAPSLSASVASLSSTFNASNEAIQFEFDLSKDDSHALALEIVFLLPFRYSISLDSFLPFPSFLFHFRFCF